MAIRTNTNPRAMDLQPEMRDILMRNGMQAHIVSNAGQHQLVVQGHDSPLLTYNLTQKQMLALTDWGTNSANKNCLFSFNKILLSNSAFTELLSKTFSSKSTTRRLCA